MNIIAVHRNYLPSTHPAEEQEIDPYRFTIHYAERPKDAKWVYKKICFKHTDAAQVTSWVTSISTRLKC